MKPWSGFGSKKLYFLLTFIFSSLMLNFDMKLFSSIFVKFHNWLKILKKIKTSKIIFCLQFLSDYWVKVNLKFSLQKYIFWRFLFCNILEMFVSVKLKEQLKECQPWGETNGLLKENYDGMFFFFCFHNDSHMDCSKSAASYVYFYCQRQAFIL